MAKFLQETISEAGMMKTDNADAANEFTEYFRKVWERNFVGVFKASL